MREDVVLATLMQSKGKKLEDAVSGGHCLLKKGVNSRRQNLLLCSLGFLLLLVSIEPMN